MREIIIYILLFLTMLMILPQALALSLIQPSDMPHKMVSGINITMDFYTQQHMNYSVHYYRVTLPSNAQGSFSLTRGQFQIPIELYDYNLYFITSITPINTTITDEWTDENGNITSAVLREDYNILTSTPTKLLTASLYKDWILEIKTPQFTSAQFNITLANTFIDPDVSACGNLSSVSGAQFNLTQNIGSTGVLNCITFNATNQILDCKGFTIIGTNSSGTSGILSARTGVKVVNCNVFNFTHGIRFNSGGSHSLIENSSFNSSLGSGGSVGNGGGVYLANGAINNTFKNVRANASINGIGFAIASRDNVFINITCYSVGFYCVLSTDVNGANNSFYNISVLSVNNAGVRLDGTGSKGNKFYGGNVRSTSAGAFVLLASAGSIVRWNIVDGVNITSGTSADDGLQISTNAWNNNFSNNILRTSGTGASISLNFATWNNTFWNNTLITTSPTGVATLLKIVGNSSGNIFYANNFSATSLLYINDSHTVGDKNDFNSSTEGNLYFNVENLSVKINGSVASTFYPTMFRGTQGSGYPYNNTNSQGKLVCGTPSKCFDYIPITPTNSVVGGASPYFCTQIGVVLGWTWTCGDPTGLIVRSGNAQTWNRQVFSASSGRKIPNGTAQSWQWVNE